MSKRKISFRLGTCGIISLISVSCSSPQTVINQPANIIPSTVAATPQTQTPLPESQPQNPADTQKVLQQAKANLMQLSAEKPLKFPLGVNSPIRRNNSSDGNSQSSKYEAIGFVDSARNPKPLKRDDLMQLLSIDVNFQTSQRLNQVGTLVANNSVTLAQNKVPVIDLIVKNKQDGKVYLIPRVNVNSLVIDAVNAAFNQSISVNNVDVTALDSSRLREGNQIRI
ncbi:MAG: hypothetical protein HGA42_17535 [Nostocales cyanobacterium W4_Combined_metabat2_030]|nr:hypothetical protein [Nostocales cyanobacterium W4_Combined_metabat2_030]